jgi:hypothetical protein
MQASMDDKRAKEIRSHIAPLELDMAWQPPKQAMLIAFKAFDEPQWVTADEATHMRDDDYVLGISIGDDAYCMPQFIIDYYHTINAQLGEHPSFFSS